MGEAESIWIPSSRTEQESPLNRCLVVFLFAIWAGLSANPSGALSVVVDARATGLFGGFGPAGSRSGLGLIEGIDISVPGQAYEIYSAGHIFLGASALPFADPGGLGPLSRISVLASPQGFSPLEGAAIDSGGTLGFEVNHLGALFGVFVPEGVLSAPGFEAIGEDAGGGVAAADLFLIGAGPLFFSAPGPGRLYLGINDPLGMNNAGAFNVTITAVPEPGTALLLGLSMLGLASIGRRRSDFSSALFVQTHIGLVFRWR